MLHRGPDQIVARHGKAKPGPGPGASSAQAVLDALPSQVAVLDAAATILMTNRSWRDFATANGGPGSTVAAATNYLAACDAAAPDPYAARAGSGLRAVLGGNRPTFTLEYPCHSDAQERWFCLRASRVDGWGAAVVLVCHEDVTRSRQAAGEVVAHAALLDEVDVALVATDLDGRITQWNRGAQRLHGWTFDEVRGHDAVTLLCAPSSADPGEPAVGALFGDGRWRRDLSARRKDGTTFSAFVHGGMTLDGEGRPAGRVGVFVDTTRRVESDQALVAARDHLRAVTDSMGEGLFTLDADGCVTYMNEVAEHLLGWKEVELVGRPVDGLTHGFHPGRAAGPGDDELVRAQRDGRVVRVEDDVFLCRDGSELPVTYTAAPLETADGVQGCVVVFSDTTERKARESELLADAETLTWIGRINDALAEDRFVLHQQPIIDLHSGQVVQRELLVRMLDDLGAIVPPGDFLPTAESYGLMGDIDRWVVRQGIELAARDGAAVQVNLSARSVGDQVVLDHIERALTETGVDPALVTFEITETALIQDETAARVFAERLHDLGCSLALDDFGTGYGGFTYLKCFPMDMVKIDIEFVGDAVASEASRHVIEAVVALAGSFRLLTVAEGIEDAETLALVRALGVDFGQGYHIARPGPIGDAPLCLPPQHRHDRITP